MAETTIKTVVELEQLGLYDSLMKQYIADKDAVKLETVAFDETTNTINFYTIGQPVGETAAAFSVTLPATDFTEINNRIADAEARIKANEDVIAAINDTIALLNDDSTVVGSVDYKIAQAVATIMENPDETMNSINELVTWINGHATDALELSNKVTANEEAIADLEELVGTEGVAKQITDAIAEALTIDGVDKYALATDLTAAIARIVTLESKTHEHTNKEVLDGITAGKVTAWDSAEQNAKDYADGLNTTMDTRVKELEDAVGEGGNVSAQIDTKIGELDANVTSATVEEGKGIQVQVVEEDGKVTNVAVIGNYDGIYDTKGSADSAKTEALEAVTALEEGQVATNTQAISDNKTAVEAAQADATEALNQLANIQFATTEDIEALFQ